MNIIYGIIIGVAFVIATIWAGCAFIATAVSNILSSLDG